MQCAPQIVTLHVGEASFRTSLETLALFPDSLLGKLHQFLAHPPTSVPFQRMDDGGFWFDADPTIFRLVLQWLRRGCDPAMLQSNDHTPAQIIAEFQYWQLPPPCLPPATCIGHTLRDSYLAIHNAKLTKTCDMLCRTKLFTMLADQGQNQAVVFVPHALVPGCLCLELMSLMRQRHALKVDQLEGAPSADGYIQGVIFAERHIMPLPTLREQSDHPPVDEERDCVVPLAGGYLRVRWWPHKRFQLWWRDEHEDLDRECPRHTPPQRVYPRGAPTQCGIYSSETQNLRQLLQDAWFPVQCSSNHNPKAQTWHLSSHNLLLELVVTGRNKYPVYCTLSELRRHAIELHVLSPEYVALRTEMRPPLEGACLQVQW